MSSANAAKKAERQAHVRKVFAELFNIADNKVSEKQQQAAMRALAAARSCCQLHSVGD
jgi:flagellar hook-basal body complex protein FliE